MRLDFQTYIKHGKRVAKVLRSRVTTSTECNADFTRLERIGSNSKVGKVYKVIDADGTCPQRHMGRQPGRYLSRLHISTRLGLRIAIPTGARFSTNASNLGVCGITKYAAVTCTYRTVGTYLKYGILANPDPSAIAAQAACTHARVKMCIM